jgi:hypothetical protein
MPAYSVTLFRTKLFVRENLTKILQNFIRNTRDMHEAIAAQFTSLGHFKLKLWEKIKDPWWKFNEKMYH